MSKMRALLLPVLCVLVGAVALAGCGEDDSSGSGSDSASTPATLAQPDSLVYVEGNLRPSGELKANVDSVAKSIAGIGNLGDFVVSKLEGSSRGGDPVDFATEIDPWLGDRAGVSFDHLEEDGDLSEPLIAIETTDAKATQAFIDKQAQRSDRPAESGAYKGVDYKIGGPERDAVGVIGEWLVLADDKRGFETAVDASAGDSLAGEDRFQKAMEAASKGSLADVYADVGGLLEQSDDRIDPQAREALQSSGIDPSEATAVASLIPGAEEIEVDLSSDLGGEEAPSGDVSELLGSVPAESFAAFAVSGFGEQLQEAVDNLDETGLPPDLKPGELKDTLGEGGIDLDQIIGSLEDAAIFAIGSGENIGGAMVVTASSDEAAKAVADLGRLLRTAQIEGVTAVSGYTSGFSVSSPDLGSNPIVVVAKGSRVAIGYGLPQTIAGLNVAGGPTLADNKTYKAAVASLGKTPISAFVDGPAALGIAEALVPRSEEDFWEARPYLKAIEFLALGTGSDDDLATAKLIAGLGK